MANCERCGRTFERRGIPSFVVCETEPCVFCCSGYASCEVNLCPECTVDLEKFMNEKMRGNDNGKVE